MKDTGIDNGIPISPQLRELSEKANNLKNNIILKDRLLYISVLTIVVAIAVSFIAKGLVYLINIVTNISFYGTFNVSFHSPADNHLGLLVILFRPLAGYWLV